MNICYMSYKMADWLRSLCGNEDKVIDCEMQSILISWHSSPLL